MRSVCSVLVCGAVAGCTASADEVRPPPDELVFPTGVVVAPGERIAFVANANSELRYDSGSIGVIDLASVDAVAAAWMATQEIPSGLDPDDRPICEPDPDHRETLVCHEGLFMLAEASALARSMGYERRSVWTLNRCGAPAYTSITRRRFLGMGASACSFG